MEVATGGFQANNPSPTLQKRRTSGRIKSNACWWPDVSAVSDAADGTIASDTGGGSSPPPRDWRRWSAQSIYVKGAAGARRAGGMVPNPQSPNNPKKQQRLNTNTSIHHTEEN